jgi:hypothetical protein
VSTSEVITYLESHGLAVGGVLVPTSVVRPEALAPLCHDYLNGRISRDDLEKIAQFLQEGLARAAYDENNCSDPMCDYDARVETLLYDLYAPDTWYNPKKSDPAYCIRTFLAETPL